MSRQYHDADVLEARLARLRAAPGDPDLQFHAITLASEADGRLTMSVCSRFVGWHDLERRVELRVSSPVTAGYAAAHAETGTNCLFVFDLDALLLFLSAGGVGLVERNLAETYFPDLTEPFPAYPLGRGGFIGDGLLEPGALKRAPSPKKRMAVLNRDGRRCRICGRRPDDHVDLEIHVHHIRPWGDGGLTDGTNLVTLCHTCHSGLDPHFDRSLFDLVEQRDSLALLESLDRHVADYRRANPLGDLLDPELG